MSYDYKRILKLLEEEREKHRADYIQIKDMDKNCVAIIIVNALNKAQKDIQEKLDAGA